MNDSVPKCYTPKNRKIYAYPIKPFPHLISRKKDKIYHQRLQSSLDSLLQVQVFANFKNFKRFYGFCLSNALLLIKSFYLNDLMRSIKRGCRIFYLCLNLPKNIKKKLHLLYLHTICRHQKQFQRSVPFHIIICNRGTPRIYQCGFLAFFPKVHEQLR